MFIMSGSVRDGFIMIIWARQAGGSTALKKHTATMLSHSGGAEGEREKEEKDKNKFTSASTAKKTILEASTMTCCVYILYMADKISIELFLRQFYETERKI